MFLGAVSRVLDKAARPVKAVATLMVAKMAHNQQHGDEVGRYNVKCVAVRILLHVCARMMLVLCAVLPLLLHQERLSARDVFAAVRKM
jgi:hypothetical protein